MRKLVRNQRKWGGTASMPSFQSRRCRRGAYSKGRTLALSSSASPASSFRRNALLSRPAEGEYVPARCGSNASTVRGAVGRLGFELSRPGEVESLRMRPKIEKICAAKLAAENCAGATIEFEKHDDECVTGTLRAVLVHVGQDDVVLIFDLEFTFDAWPHPTRTSRARRRERCTR